MNRVHSGRIVAAAACVIAVCSLASCAKKRQTPDFALKDSAGKTVQLSDYRGKVVLLNFWATWCAPCKIEIPWFMEFQRDYKGQDFAVLGVSMDEDGWNSVRPYMKDHQFNYPVVIGNDDVGKLFGEIDDLPTTFIIDRDGRIAKKHVGLIGKNDYKDEIGALLKGQVLKGSILP
ncbi:MAG TPA: TlpA disulfide reductase family protein [Bryobacteraceae bacterium]|jgi:peroxiredoxin